MTAKHDESQKMSSADRLHNLTQGTAQERAEAAESLAQQGPNAAFAATELVKACGDEQAISDWAVAALEELGPPPTAAISSLAKLTGSDNAQTAYWAITLLGRAGREAASHQNLLAEILEQSGEISLKERAAWGLGRMHADSAKAVMALKQAALSQNERLSRLSGKSLQTQT